MSDTEKPVRVRLDNDPGQEPSLEPREPLPAADPAEAPAAATQGWQGALASLGGRLERHRLPPLPAALERLAPVQNVLDNAGERGTVTLPDGRIYGAYGFPDLVAPRSKVLLLREAEPLPELLALHRHPVQAGTCVLGGEGLLPGAERDADGPAIQRTGAPLPSPGTLFALDGGEVFVQRGRRVWSWDGRREREAGSPHQALASLVLRWSQR